MNYPEKLASHDLKRSMKFIKLGTILIMEFCNYPQEREEDAKLSVWHSI